MHFALLLWLFISFMPKAESFKTVFITKTAEITLFSEAPLENIEAVTKNAYGVINTENNEIQFGVSIKSFRFKKSLMQEHFNENYMESDKYPVAKFKGRFDSPINFSKDGEYPVTATGELEVHGLAKKRTISGIVKMINGRLEINSAFDVECRDHDIEIPSIVFKKIAEKIKITFKGSFTAVP